MPFPNSIALYTPKLELPVIKAAPVGGSPAAYYQQLQINVVVTSSGLGGEFADIAITRVANPQTPPAIDATLFAMMGGFVRYFPPGTIVPSPDNLVAPAGGVLVLQVWAADILAQERAFPPTIPSLGRVYYVGVERTATEQLLRIQVAKMSIAALIASWKDVQGAAPPQNISDDDLIDHHWARVIQAPSTTTHPSVFVDPGTPIGKAAQNGAESFQFSLRTTKCRAPISYVSPLKVFKGAPFLTLDLHSVNRTEIENHPLVAASPAIGNFAIVEINPATEDRSKSNYITWAPTPAKVWLETTDGSTGELTVILKNSPNLQSGVTIQDLSGDLLTDPPGEVVFYRERYLSPEDTLELKLNYDGTPVDFLIGGKWPHFSVEDKDAGVAVEVKSSGVVLGKTALMVRVRRNANNLTVRERDRFLKAMAFLNNSGKGRFAEFRDMHVAASKPQAHGAPGFLPWHRAYILDLERELQNLDPSVTLPYWKFDEKAPNLFSRDFIGLTENDPNNPNNQVVKFSDSNYLISWGTDGVAGVLRKPKFNTDTEPAIVKKETDTLTVSPDYQQFWKALEADPHGAAHVSFKFGSINHVPTAAKDPLFFLLHSNVDRLWAKWQSLHKRHNVNSDPKAFYEGSRVQKGHHLNDTMWPWDRDEYNGRPSTAPGGAFADSPIVNAPGNAPYVRDMFDYQGVLSAANRLDFDYDDVRFEWLLPTLPIPFPV